MALVKVLYVDDDPWLLSGMQLAFAKDFELATFERGYDALKYLVENSDISALVTDMCMPEMDGLKLLKLSKKIRPDLKSIMVTGNSDQKTAIDAINEGRIFRFLKKPCELAQLKKAIELAVEETTLSKKRCYCGGPIEDLKERPCTKI